jgi:hypothetical protein
MIAAENPAESQEGLHSMELHAAVSFSILGDEYVKIREIVCSLQPLWTIS